MLQGRLKEKGSMEFMNGNHRFFNSFCFYFFVNFSSILAFANKALFAKIQVLYLKIINCHSDCSYK